MPVFAKALAHIGYNDCPAAREEYLGLRPALPVPEARLRRRMERLRQTPDARRAETRAAILLNGRLFGDSDNAWQRGQIEQNRRHHILKYKLLLSAMKAEPRPELPCGAALELSEAA